MGWEGLFDADETLAGYTAHRAFLRSTAVLGVAAHRADVIIVFLFLFFIQGCQRLAVEGFGVGIAGLLLEHRRQAIDALIGRELAYLRAGLAQRSCERSGNAAAIGEQPCLGVTRLAVGIAFSLAAAWNPAQAAVRERPDSPAQAQDWT
mgnify:CR=1 FL=1